MSVTFLTNVDKEELQREIENLRANGGGSAEVTTESITNALGFTPASEEVVSQLSEEIDDHKNDGTIHVTATEKQTWNGKVDKTGISLDKHTDGLIYIFIDGVKVGNGVEVTGEVVEGDVVGTVDENNNLLLSGSLADGTYTLKYENEDGTYAEVGSLVVGAIEEPEPTYTNLIPLSTDASGNPYVGTNGENGYKDGYKISVTGGGESSASGYKCTGFIPIKYDDTLYFKGIGFESTGTNTNFCCYDSSKARIGGNNWRNIFSSGVNGQVVSVAVKDLVLNTGIGDVQDDLQNVAYIRLSASVMDENSIITVNEPIE